MPDELPETGQPAPRRGISTGRLYRAVREDPNVAKDGGPEEHEVVRKIESFGFDLAAAARQNRRFHYRAVERAAKDGFRRFLDVGCGMPEEFGTNTHEIVQAVTADADVLYVDREPVVLAHQEARNRSGPLGRTRFVQADLREPDKIIAEARKFLNPYDDEPICLMLIAVVHFLADSDDPYGVVTRLSAAMPPGSRMILSHATDEHSKSQARAAEAVMAEKGEHGAFRSYDAIRRFFYGHQVLPPGLTAVHHWRPDDPEAAAMPAERIPVFGGVCELNT